MVVIMHELKFYIFQPSHHGGSIQLNIYVNKSRHWSEKLDTCKKTKHFAWKNTTHVKKSKQFYTKVKTFKFKGLNK